MNKNVSRLTIIEYYGAIFMACVAFISLLALAGWVFNLPILASLRPDYIPMAPVTTLVFMGLDGAWLIQRVFPDRPAFRRLVRAGLLGLLLLVIILALRYFTGLGPDLEKLLYPNPPLFRQFSSARISPLSALGFLLAIPALLLLTGSQPGTRIKSVSAALSLTLFTLSGLLCMGYLFGAPLFYGGPLIPVAITSALAFCFLSLGLLMLAGPACWPLRMYAGHSLKARLMRTFIPASISIVLLQGLLSKSAEFWIANPGLNVAIPAFLACLIVMLIISFIANNLSADFERGRQAEQALIKTQQIYRQAITRAGGVPYQLDYASESYAFLGEGFESLTGYPPAEMTGPLFATRLRKVETFGEYKDLTHEQYIRLARQGGVDEWREDYLFERKDGQLVWLADHSVQIKTEEGNAIGSLGILMDISGRKQAEAALRQSEAELRALFASMHDVVLVIDRQGVYREIAPTNPSMLVKPAEQLIGKTLQDVFPTIQAETFLKVVQQVLNLMQTARIEYVLSIGGQNVWFETSISPMTEDRTLWVAHDITLRKQMEEQIRNLSLTDELTGLYNRRGFTLLAEQELKTAMRFKRSSLLFYADLDDLKMINDTWGHAQGDLALQEMAAILKETFRESDILARIGGDEFVVLAVDAPMEKSDIILNHLQATLEQHKQSGDRAWQLSFSQGIASYDDFQTPCSLSELISEADARMYAQKQARQKKF